MQLNRTTDYVVRIVYFLSNENRIFTSEEISEAIGCSRPDAISLFDVIKIMEDTICINQCLNEEENCNLKATDYCPVRRFYLSLQEQIESELKHMTFEMLRKSGGGRIEYFNSS